MSSVHDDGAYGRPLRKQPPATATSGESRVVSETVACLVIQPGYLRGCAEVMVVIDAGLREVLDAWHMRVSQRRAGARRRAVVAVVSLALEGFRSPVRRDWLIGSFRARARDGD